MRKILIFGIVFFFGCGQKSTTQGPIKKNPYLHIAVKNFGEIVVRLYPDEAPKNVKNVMELANKGFYNGLKFHRVIKGFVIQGGCPKGDGTGDPGYELEDEISPKLKHLKGTVAMANRGPNTNGSQFYICLEPQPRLDGRYTIIGEVVEGMAVVEKIGEVPTSGPPFDRPLEDVIMEKVWIEEH
ncbi:MAG: peptidylprolyl isomerase [candidate division WOR-3 bacterium]